VTTADLIVVADHIHGLAPSPEHPALAVKGGRITAIGDRSEVSAWRGPDTRVLEFPGATIVPGLTDAHSHPVLGAMVSRGVDLTQVKTLEELRAAIAAERHRPHHGWIFGWGLNHSIWGAAEITSEAIEEVSPDVPVLIRMFDAHSALANRAALAAAGVHSEATFPSGSRVVVDHHGRPTGLVLEVEAMALLERVAPAEERQELLARLRSQLEAMAASGLTGAHVMDFEHDPADLYTALDEAGQLPLRLKIHPWAKPGSTRQDWEALRSSIGTGGRLWSLWGVKTYLDGTIDGGTAWLHRPDRDGLSLHSSWPEPEAYREAIAYFAEHHIGTATHAIGDAAVAYAAQSIAGANARFPGTRHRIEHLELTSDEVVSTVAASGAIASMQPTHCTHFVTATGTDNWSRRLGDHRTRHAWRTRSLLKAGTPLALGSDWPIAPFAPLPIMADAQLRRPVHDPAAAPVAAHEALTGPQALAAYTSGAAFATGTEHEEGSIRLGGLADLTILSADPTTTPAEELTEITVLTTIVDGTVRHHAAAVTASSLP
jgi:predicted amidohydrolase YtcJ